MIPSHKTCLEEQSSSTRNHHSPQLSNWVSLRADTGQFYSELKDRFGLRVIFLRGYLCWGVFIASLASSLALRIGIYLFGARISFLSVYLTLLLPTVLVAIFRPLPITLLLLSRFYLLGGCSTLYRD